MGFGASAVVLEPEQLRAEIQADLEKLLATYHGETGNSPDGLDGVSPSRTQQEPSTRMPAPRPGGCLP
jgi:hypothetical protein